MREACAKLWRGRGLRRALWGLMVLGAGAGVARAQGGAVGGGGSGAVGGEEERDLWCVPMEGGRAGSGRAESGGSAARGGGLIALPFFDDFSTPSFADAPDEIPEALLRWEAGSARITQTYALMPPTIGVATLEGLDRTGYPYSFNGANPSGWCDTLTSLPINLGGYTAESGVHLVFHYQGGGRGNAPDVGEDELVLEFKTTGGGGETLWTEVWSTTERSTTEFTRAIVPVADQIHLQPGFQFRFRNYGALSGNVDMWHIDYVFLDDNIDPATFEILSEVAFVEPEYTFLRQFSRMPWTHFIGNPGLHMLDSTTTLHRNLSGTQADNVIGGYRVAYQGDIESYTNTFANTFVAPFEVFNTGYYVNDSPNNFVFDASVNDTCATFEVSLWESSIGLLHTEKVGVIDNDSIRFDQVFVNDYAYDDGSAEKAYALTAAGGKVALRYQLAEEDTLLGLAIHFTPYYTNAAQETFLLRAWADEAGIPGAELGENYYLHSPLYFTAGHDVFAYYPFDAPIPVEGVIHVGLVQTGNTMLNFGLDKNSSANIGKLRYQLGLGGEWLASGIEGTVMIRPVLRAGKQEVWTGVVEAEGVEPGEGLRVFPNPTTGLLQVQMAQAGSWVVSDLTGKVCAQGTAATEHWTLDASEWSPGMYVLRTDTGATVRWMLH